MRSTTARAAARGPAAGPPRPRLSLTRQLLVFQLSLLAIVLVAVTAISLEQTRTTFESMQQRRMLAVAEYAAANPLLRSILSAGSDTGVGSDAGAGTDPVESRPQRLAAPVETLRTTTGVDELLVTDPIGRVLASPADPRLLGGSLRLEGPRPASDGSWSGVAPLGTVSHVVARVPVLDNAGRLVGMIVAGRQVPAFAGLLATASREKPHANPPVLSLFAEIGAEIRTTLARACGISHTVGDV